MALSSLNTQVVLSSRPVGVPLGEHFTIQSVPVPKLNDGEFLIKTQYWSVDPAQRGWANDVPNYMPPVALGEAMRALAVGTVVASRSPDYVEGDVVSGLLGLNGLTAYLGLTHGCSPKTGDTVIASTAAGAVGSAVGQIAKILGCRTVGITSSVQKMEFCKSVYNYDEVISYRVDDISEAIKAVCPDGVDRYFDNACGPISDAVMAHLRHGARITICGTSAATEWSPTPVGPRVHRQLLVARARMQGFIMSDHKAEFDQTYDRLSDWIRQGILTYREDVLDGIEHAPAAIEMLYRGENNGKLLIKVA